MDGSGRGVVYMVWGDDPKIRSALERSKASLARVHPELPIEVIEIAARDPYEGLRAKSTIYERSPFRETLLLDVDTVVFGRLDYAFEKAWRYGLACCINECPWARRYGGLSGDIIEYNTGVLFFNVLAAPIFEAWRAIDPDLDASALIVSDAKVQGKLPYSDQASFAAAIERADVCPFALPLNWNFRPQWHRSFFGSIRIWHDYAEPPALYQDLARYYAADDAVIQYVELR